jgi:hypothetical protein
VFKRLALCVGAGGNGMSKGLLREEWIVQKTKKPPSEPGGFVEDKLIELLFNGIKTLCTSQRDTLELGIKQRQWPFSNP